MTFLFFESFHKGGFIMWPIFLVSVVVWTMGLAKLLRLRRFSRARKRFNAGFGRICCGEPELDFRWNTGEQAFDTLGQNLAGACRSGNTKVFGLFREFLVTTVPELNRGLSTMAAWTSSAPLLGLLGTVTGMIYTFKAITMFGVGNPHFTAEGISVALLTTQAGLTVAFPAMLFHNYINNRKSGLVNRLLSDAEKQVKALEKCYQQRLKKPDLSLD